MVTVFNKYIYDNAGRKLKTWEQITNTNQAADTLRLISQASYNEIGQLYQKQLDSKDSTNFKQTIAYTYNERGWLLSSSASLFEMQLQYNADALSLGISKQYNGNIASQSYGTQSSPNANYYAYNYDKLNRLLAGNNTYTAFSENAISYDVMGNLTALTRYTTGGVPIDELSYSYAVSGNPTNQLQSVTDAMSNNAGMMSGTTSYTYDGNGNMLSAINTVNTTNNKSFTYNLLNLPLVATVPTGTVTYTYDAAGTKLRKVSTVNNNSTDYISGIQYDGATTPALSFIQTEEGKAVPITSSNHYDYTYYLGDNLGNTRVTFDTKTGIAVSQQTDDYYPFGLEIPHTVASPKNKYLYNKKELQDELTEYDYGARFYDPVIGRWTSVDPLAEKSRRFSSYVYVEDSPIRMIDPDGMEGEIVHPNDKKSLNVIKNTLTKSDQAFIKLDKNGNIDKKSIDSHKSSSGNYNSLKELVDSKKTTTVSVNNKYDYKTASGAVKTDNMGPITMDTPNPHNLVTTTGEDCNCGVTQLPVNGESHQSTDNNVNITINSGLSDLGMAEVFSHEAYGHDKLFIEGKPSEHNVIPKANGDGFTEGNIPLKVDISKAIHETLQNYQNAHSN